MMKWGFTVNAVAGAVLVATAVGSSQGDSQSLQLSLDRTLRELELLAGLRERVERGDREAIAAVVKLAPVPSADRQAEDARLEKLRVEVARLEMQRDGLAPLPVRTPTEGPKPAEKAKVATPVPAPGTNLTTFEAAGFSADIVKQGEVLFRAERFDDCVKLLRGSSDDPRAHYWTARSLEHLGRVDEAIEIYTSLAASKAGGWAVERASADLDFLRWKRTLEKPAKAGKDAQKP